MSDLVGGTACNGCGQPCGHAPGIGYFCQNDACTYEKDRARDILRRMRPIDPKDARITELETALAEARNAAFEEAAKVADEWNELSPFSSRAQAIRDMKDRT